MIHLLLYFDLRVSQIDRAAGSTTAFINFTMATWDRQLDTCR